MNSFLLGFGIFVILCSFLLCLGRFLSCLMVIENLNVLLLFNSILCQSGEPRMFFLILMVIFTVEVVLGLVVLVRLWDMSNLMFEVGL